MGIAQFTRKTTEIDSILDEVEEARGSQTTLKGYIDTGLSGKQATLVAGTNLDTVPTANSTNPITSGGIYTAMIGTEISPPQGETWHLRDYLTPGVYRVLSSAFAGRIDDAPLSDRGYMMIVQQLSTEDYFCQTIIPAVNQSHADHFWRRHYRGSGNTSGQKGFSNWFEYAGTDTGSGAYIPPAEQST